MVRPLKDLFLGHDSAGRRVMLNPRDRLCHAHVIGSSGGGKSKFLELLMRQDLDNRQGFCLLDPEGTLYNAVMKYAAFHGFDTDIIPLNLSESGPVIGFNPFQRASGDAAIDVQVDHRIEATMHAWNIKNTDETPRLARILRLVYTVMIERNLGLQQTAHLVNFDDRDIRNELTTDLDTPLIEGEWRELHVLRAREFRDEVESAKNKLFKFLTSPTIGRFMGVPGHSINLGEVIEQQKKLLVNLAPSDRLSEDNARAVGALLVNEFREVAMRRKPQDGRDPDPYYLYIDEFQNFVSLDIANMLDRIRKRGVFLVMAHQRFSQLDENLIDAVLANCRIKTVFGGLPVPAARRMAEELFIGKLDPMKIKAAIYQTKFWPRYSRDTVYTTGTGRSTSSSHSSGTSGSDASYATDSTCSSQAYFYDNWFSLPQLSGTRTETTSRGSASMTGHSNSWSDSSSESYGYTESSSVADIPIFVPVPFQELSSVQYWSLDEQLHQMTVALKEQFQRHCFIKIQEAETQPLLVPFIRDFYLSNEADQSYRDQKLEQCGALPIAQVDELLKQQETALLQAAKPELTMHPVSLGNGADRSPEAIWTRVAPDTVAPDPTAATSGVSSRIRRKRGPRTDLENHEKVLEILRPYGDNWCSEDNLFEICEALDQHAVPIPKTWSTLKDRPCHSWQRAREYHPDLVKKALRYRRETAEASTRQLPLTLDD